MTLYTIRIMGAETPVPSPLLEILKDTVSFGDHKTNSETVLAIQTTSLGMGVAGLVIQKTMLCNVDVSQSQIIYMYSTMTPVPKCK